MPHERATGAPHPLLMSYWPGQLRPYQQDALAELDERWHVGDRRAWVVLPPGAGKTLVGLEAARRLGRRTVVLTPNTAIQGQWIDHWSTFTHPQGTRGAATPTAGASRNLIDDVTVLTYQSLAVFAPDDETDEDGRERSGSLRERLHANGEALVAALHRSAPITLVLDECHHLLQVWGRLLAEILADMPEAHVIGLTGTPSESLTSAEHDLVAELFGAPVHGASIPALVRDGYLAPFTELAWVTSPTGVEHSYLAGQARRFRELCTDLLEPGFASVSFLGWLHTRFHERRSTDGYQLHWDELATTAPAQTDAALRLHHAGLLDLPPGARLLERHRHSPHAEDWTALLEDYLDNCLRPRAAAASPDPAGTDTDTDTEAIERIRAALPSVGYQLTKRGIRRGRSPLDRVLARSAAKSQAVVEIAAIEAASLGPGLRMLALCDHERATARLSSRLRDVLSTEAGSAWLLLQLLSTDDRTRDLNPILVTGRSVAAAAPVAQQLLTWIHQRQPGLELGLEPAGPDADAQDTAPETGAGTPTALVRITGNWNSRTWVRFVTDYVESGASNILIGTRALLGEGWDAPRINAVVDLTTATTTTAVTQSRGRALRLDPDDPNKVAHTWTVTCVTHDHPRGHTDWDRFVRKHQGYLGVNSDGEVLSGVTHIDPEFSPYDPPQATRLDAINARMITRAQDRPATRERWRLGIAYSDQLLPTLQIRTTRTAPAQPAASGYTDPPAAVPAQHGFRTTAAAQKLPRTRMHPLLTGATGVLALGTLGLVTASQQPVLIVLTVLAVLTGLTLGLRRRRRRYRILDTYAAAAATDADVLRIGYAVADALHRAGHVGAGSAAVRPHVGADGAYRITLDTAEHGDAETFTTALDEVLSPLVGNIRYLIPRYHLDLPATARLPGRFLDAAYTCRLPANPVVYHRVPAVLARNRAGADAFAHAWRTWVCDGTATYTGGRAGTERTHGQQLLYLYEGSDPYPAQTATRLVWS